MFEDSFRGILVFGCGLDLSIDVLRILVEVVAQSGELVREKVECIFKILGDELAHFEIDESGLAE